MAAVLWNSGDKSANITLSGGSLTATTTSSLQGGVRADTSFASGKYYYEAEITVLAGSSYAIGWANASAAIGAALGTNKDSVVLFPSSTQSQTHFNGGILGTDQQTGFAPATIGVAFDIDGLQIWTRYNGSIWNGDPTADPGTSTGGFSIATMNAGPYFPVFSANGSGAQVIANFGVTNFFYALPAGFSALDTNAQSYLAVSKMIGLGPYAPPVDAVSASKMLGYADLDPPVTALSISKLIAYAIMVPLVGANITEAASATDTASAALSLSASLSEAAAATDTVSIILGPSAALDEPGAATDAVDAILIPAQRPLWMTIGGDIDDSIFPN